MKDTYIPFLPLTYHRVNSKHLKHVVASLSLLLSIKYAYISITKRYHSYADPKALPNLCTGPVHNMKTRTLMILLSWVINDYYMDSLYNTLVGPNDLKVV